MFLLDADMLSQPTKPLPNVAATLWQARNKTAVALISVVTLQELQFGIERMPSGAKRTKLERWLQDDILRGYADRILPFTQEIALLAGKTHALAIARGYNPSLPDVQVAATALYHDLTLATLNRRHFTQLGVPLADLES